MRTICSALALSLCVACGGAAPFIDSIPLPVAASDAGTAPADAGLSDGGVAQAGPSLGGCPMFPAENDFNRDISQDLVDPHSADYVSFMGASQYLQPDFGGPYGQPFLIVPADEARVPMTFEYASQSDPGPYPYPLDVPIQSDPDKHATVLSQGDCKLYETYLTRASGDGFHAGSGAMFDLMTGAPRPDGWTSATAAGLPILPGMARYDEAVEQGVIAHALVFTAGATAHSYVFPATHSSGNSSAPYAPPLGLRVRLQASFDLSGYSGASLVILRALQRYGMYLTDTAGGQFWAVAGSLDSRWPSANLEQLKTVPTSAFEVVQPGPIHAGL